MRPLTTTYHFLIWFCICPAEWPENRWQKIAHIVFTISMLGLILCDTAASMAFCCEFIAIDLERCMFALMSLCAAFGITYNLIAALTQMRHKIANVFVDLSEIYKIGECSFAFKIIIFIQIYSCV